ncbi:methanogenic corrinoid protein MtbC1 [Salsuginibacillus halophilus]|uniref:Methanogenic corrinoid protein MtbC1 n=1 Tax=Salsuginibacillus halophilus TaxID=517424 RepID=A0A2P8HDW4_9BACI|nr:B12-binding domain-containing protein [Salsuginibacillus halophilus]PSL44414.1 methanogenic corrinoid protein MtbC1 [Salsuginibacillus halophilus]
MELEPRLFAEHLLAGDDVAALLYVQKALEHFSHTDVYEHVMTPAMYHVGDLWEQNKITVAEEHLATGVCDFVLAQIDHRDPPAAEAPRVLLCCLEGEEHYLGLKMAASIFRRYGWHVRFLGPTLPLEHVLKDAAQFQPQVIGLSGALAYRIPQLKASVETLKAETNADIIISGRTALIYDLGAQVGYAAATIASLEALENWLEDGNEGTANATI